jgi:two-component system response regulator RstA
MKKNIILVEDDCDLAELTSGYLSSYGYGMTIVSDGLLAVDIIVEQQPDLVILDLMLPGLDGLEVCKRIRPDFSNPVLMFTARNDEIDEILGLEMGADDYISKPVEPRLLAARVKALLRRSSAKASAAGDENDHIEVNGLVVNDSSRTVSLNSEPISLSTPEYDLLHFVSKIYIREFARC